MSLEPENVTAVLVTRGDVDLTPILAELPYGEVVVWDNSRRSRDFGLYGRYMGILEASRPVIYFQDDDCLVRNHDALMAAYEPGTVVGNFKIDPARQRYYDDTTLLGWGSLFDYDLPWHAWHRYAQYYPMDAAFINGVAHEFTWPVLTPHKKVLVKIEPGGSVEWLREDGAEVFARENRMSNQPGFYGEIDEALARARMVRDKELMHR